MRAAAVIAIGVVAVGCSGGDATRDAAMLDAADPTDAPTSIDAPPEVTCAAGGAATVSLDLGTDAAPRAFTSAWWNRGHASKACWKIDVVLSTASTIAGSYLSDPELVELAFAAPPVIGANPVQVHLHAPDRYLAGTVTLSSQTPTDVVGTVDARDGAIVLTGAFTALQCAAIFDPCI